MPHAIVSGWQYGQWAELVPDSPFGCIGSAPARYSWRAVLGGTPAHSRYNDLYEAALLWQDDCSHGDWLVRVPASTRSRCRTHRTGASKKGCWFLPRSGLAQVGFSAAMCSAAEPPGHRERRSYRYSRCLPAPLLSSCPATERRAELPHLAGGRGSRRRLWEGDLSTGAVIRPKQRPGRASKRRSTDTPL
jgi:hypothetical protein